MKAVLVVAILIFIFSVSLAFSRDQEAAARIAAGCGPNQAQFEVKTNKKQHPTGQPEAGKALVYIFADEDEDNAGFRIGGLTSRVGLDGGWVGANDWKSYFFFPVDAGEHRLCTSQQSVLKSRTKKSAAASFTAEAGTVYYFRTKTPQSHLPQIVELVPVDPAEAQLLIASS